jgi:hypothetical protein
MTLDTAGSLRITQMLQGQLRPGEELVWSGMPARGALIGRGDGYFIPFSILWLTFACFWEFGATQTGGGVFFGLWGIPFIAIGLYAVAGRFVYKRYSHGRTAYGVTRDRALIVTPTSFRDQPLAGVPVTVYRSHGGRRATVLMSTPDVMPPRVGVLGTRRSRSARAYAMYANTGMEPLMRSAVWPFAFYDVDNPDAMLAAIDQARTGSTW